MTTTETNVAAAQRRIESRPARSLVPNCTRTPDDLEARWERMRQEAETRAHQLREWLAGQPKTVTCPRHPGVTRLLDIDLSERATLDAREKTAAYTPCPECQQEHALARQNHHLHECGVPDVLLHCTFTNWIPRDETERAHLEVAKRFTELRHGFLVMLGGLGCGKSHLAVAIMRMFRAPWYTSQGQLLYLLRRTYRGDGLDPVEQGQHADLLVLDELGVSVGGRDELPMLHTILDHRYGERKPTILAGNIQLPELRQIIGDRMADRLRECAVGVLMFGGQSHRPERRDEYLQPMPHED